MSMADKSDKGEPVNPGLVARLTQSVKYAITGVKPKTWMGPAQPIQPAAQEAGGRQFDYPVGINTNYAPATQEKYIGFAQLRLLADNFDLVRLAIETRKDQLARLKWRITPRDPDGEANEEVVNSLTAFFQFPDKQNDWNTWLRAVIEDVLVIDAPCIYPRFTAGNELYSLELMDGATINVLINDDGRQPLPPSPAYQQVLHGVPAVNYTRDELIYTPRNVRTHRLYGFSVVEQIITTINIALRRQASQLEYYTAGSVPDSLASVPESWSGKQLADFQFWWDEINSSSAERRKLKFIPGGINYHATKDSPLKDDYDEWLAKIVSYAFSTSPIGLQKQINRSSAETSQAAAEIEGLLPMMEWVSNLMNRIIVKYFGVTDLIFSWQEEVEDDALRQAQINDVYIRNGTKSVDEVRAELGLLPIGMENAVYGAMGVNFVKDLIGQDYAPARAVPEDKQILLEDKSEAAEKIAKASKKKSVLKPINRDRRRVIVATNKLRNFWAKFFRNEAKRIAKQLTQMLGKADSDEVNRIMDAINLDGFAVTVSDVEEILIEMGRDGANMAWLQLGGIPDDQSIVNTADKLTVEYARQRAAELVGMKYTKSGKLIENPSPLYAITDTTRESLQSLVTQALEQGWSNDILASKIENSYAFSESRADMIARTETRRADMQGSMIAYKESGLVQGKYSVLSNDYDKDDECGDNAAAGIIGIDEAFPSGDDMPPYHPGCRCDLVAAVIEGVPESGEIGETPE